MLTVIARGVRLAWTRYETRTTPDDAIGVTWKCISGGPKGHRVQHTVREQRRTAAGDNSVR